MIKRVTSIFLCILLVFSLVITDYKKVSAFEWAIPTITFDVALPFLMGLLGVTYATSDSTLVPTEDEFFSFAEEQNIAGPDVRAWLDNVFSGTLYQASNVWSCFKSWVKSLVNGSSTGGVSVRKDLLEITKLVVNSITSINIGNYDSEAIANYSINSGYAVMNSDGVSYDIYLFDSNYFYANNTNNFSFYKSNTSRSYYLLINAAIGSTEANLSYISATSFFKTISDFSNTFVFGVDSVPSGCTLVNLSNITSDLDFESLINDITNLDLISSDAISTSIPDVVTLPWQNVGDTTQDISQTIEGLIDAVNEGTLELSDLVTTIQGLLGVITVDTSEDIVIPEVINPDTEEPVTPEEVISENINNSAFILSGLEKVFPFCLPFDLYNFFTLLVADPVAPVINFPIYDPTTKETIDIVIDFSQWESVVILFRYIFDFLFIIGMILVSRSLIGGGDKS